MSPDVLRRDLVPPRWLRRSGAVLVGGYAGLAVPLGAFYTWTLFSPVALPLWMAAAAFVLFVGPRVPEARWETANAIVGATSVAIVFVGVAWIVTRGDHSNAHLLILRFTAPLFLWSPLASLRTSPATARRLWRGGPARPAGEPS